jgi:PKD repeat protein
LIYHFVVSLWKILFAMKFFFFFLSPFFLPVFILAQPFSGLYNFVSVTTTSGTTDPTPPPTATGLTFGSFNAVGTPVNPNASGLFSFVNWAGGSTNGNDNYASLTGSVDTSEYYQVTLTPANGYAITISSVTFAVQRSGTGIRTYSVRSSLDGFASNITATINPANPNLSVQPGDVFFWNFDAVTTQQNGSRLNPGSSYTNIMSPVTFRFYAWNSESGTGTFSIDDVVFNGTATQIFILADFSYSQTCFGDSTYFTDNSISFNGPVNSWIWDFGDLSPFSTVQNPVHLYANPGFYNVRLIVGNTGGDFDTLVRQIEVKDVPLAAFSLSQDTGCAPHCVTFTNSSTGAATYLWNFGNSNTSASPNPVYCYSTGGSFSGFLVAYHSTSGCPDTAYFPNVILVYPQPVAGFTSNANGLTVNFTNTSSGTAPLSYVFDPGDGSPVYTNFPSSHTYASSGIYPVCLLVTDANGCTDTLCTSISVTISGIIAHGNVVINVFPNPVSEIVNVELSNLTTTGTIIRLLSLDGKILKEFSPSAPLTSFSMAGHSPGTYWIQVLRNGEPLGIKTVQKGN